MSLLNLRLLLIPTALAATFLLGGCQSQSTLTAASTLSKAGQAAAVQMEQNATLSSSQFSALQTAEIFHRNFVPNRSPENAAADQPIDTALANLQRELTAYAKYLDSLASAYTALGSLATYNSSSEFTTAYSTLVTNTNSLLKTVGQKPLSSPISGAVQNLGGLVLGYIQQQQVIENSKLIRATLQAVINGMASSDAEARFTGFLDVANRETRTAAMDLYSTHVYSITPLLDQIGEPIGLKSASNADQIAAGNPNVMNGINAVLQAQFVQQNQAIAANYEKSVAALKALLPLHDAVEEGKPLDLADLSMQISQLQSLANALKPAKGS
jgi:hypothetical protein